METLVPLRNKIGQVLMEVQELTGLVGVLAVLVVMKVILLIFGLSLPVSHALT